MPSRQTWNRWASAAILLVGGAILFFEGGLSEAHDQRVLNERGIEVPARVLERREGRPSVLTVRFETREGKRVVAETDRFREPVERGDRVHVLYDPNDPTRVREVRYGGSYDVAIVGTVLGATFLLLGAWIAARGMHRWLKRERSF